MGGHSACWPRAGLHTPTVPWPALDTSPPPSWDCLCAMTPGAGGSFHSAPWRPNLAAEYQHVGPACWHMWKSALGFLAYQEYGGSRPETWRPRDQRPGSGHRDFTVLFTGEETEARREREGPGTFKAGQRLLWPTNPPSKVSGDSPICPVPSHPLSASFPSLSSPRPSTPGSLKGDILQGVGLTCPQKEKISSRASSLPTFVILDE